MSSLNQKRCIPCEGGVPCLTAAESQLLLKQLSNWLIIEQHHLEKTVVFDNFVEALAFTNQVGHIAESENHHPDIYLSWGKVVITIWTHKVDGLTESDFILAAKIDGLAIVSEQ